MYFQSSIFHGNNSPYIKLAFYSVSVRQGTYTRCRTNNKKKKRKNENAEEKKNERRDRYRSLFNWNSSRVFSSLVSIHCQMSRSITLLLANLFGEKLSNIYNLNKKNPICPLECRRLSGTFTSNEEKSFGTSTRVLIKW